MKRRDSILHLWSEFGQWDAKSAANERRITIEWNYFGKWQPGSLHGILEKMSPRTEKREFIALSVRVSGTDASGKNFRQPVCTLDLSSRGARITGLSGVSVGQILTLEYQNNKVRYEVVWVGQQDTPKAGQVGLRRVDNDKMLAEVQFTADYVDTWKGRS